MIAGTTPYLESAKAEMVVDKTVYLDYGAIEDEPSNPRTNLGFGTLDSMFQSADRYIDPTTGTLEGVMGNNQMMLLQFPRNFLGC